MALLPASSISGEVVALDCSHRRYRALPGGAEVTNKCHTPRLRQYTRAMDLPPYVMFALLIGELPAWTPSGCWFEFSPFWRRYLCEHLRDQNVDSMHNTVTTIATTTAATAKAKATATKAHLLYTHSHNHVTTSESQQQ